MKLFEIYYAFQEDFLRYARSLTRTTTDAEDLVQSAYLKALEHLEIFETMHPAQIKGWFFSTLRNKFIDEHRKGKRLEYVDTLPENAAPQPPGDFDLKEVIDSFPEQQRSLIVLRYVLELNSTEIATLLGTSPSTIRSRLSALNPILKKRIQEELL